ncbi:MAG: redoxin domain-containing protein [Chitinophagaceae bacterium]|nr:redoxin domain-containing protein [Chitinophagaceae bacterium]
MQKIILFLTIAILSLNVYAQTDTIPPYFSDPTIPSFTIQSVDSSWITKNDLAKKPTLILYFSPDCGHCQLETEELISNLKSLGDLQIVMITSRSIEEMKEFSDRYLLQKFPSIKIGSDPKRFVTRFYNVKFTPFSALYSKKGKLVKVYKDGIDFKELATLAGKG